MKPQTLKLKQGMCKIFMKKRDVQTEKYAHALFQAFDLALDLDHSFSLVLGEKIKSLKLPEIKCMLEKCSKMMSWFDWHLNQGFCPKCRAEWSKKEPWEKEQG